MRRYALYRVPVLVRCVYIEKMSQKAGLHRLCVKVDDMDVHLTKHFEAVLPTPPNGSELRV